MTFLNPAFLFGLFAASIPLVLHFMNLRKLRVVEFSTLAFLKELQKTKIKRIKLKQWLLLLLRTAIIIFLVMAFARPTLKSVSLGGPSTAKTTAVFIVDNTFSMSVVTDKGSYLNQAKYIAKNLLNNFQDGDEIAVISVGDIAKDNILPSSNFMLVSQTINEIPISFVSKTLNELIIKASQILYKSKNYNKEIYILTDLQKGNIYKQNEIMSLSRVVDSNTRMYLLDVNGKDVFNLGIDDLTSSNQIFTKDKTVSFTAKVRNYSTKPVTNHVVSLFINGKRSAQQSITLSAGKIKDVSFEATLADTGLVEISAELEDDDILQDNKRFFSVYVPDKISVLIISDNRDDTRFIKLAIEDPALKMKIFDLSTAQLSSLNLKNYSAIFVVGSEKGDGWKNLSAYIQQGGKVIVMPGSQSTIQNFIKLCGSIGLAKPVGAVGKVNSQQSITQIDKMDYQNPLLEDFFKNKKLTQIESPEIYHYFKINPGVAGKNVISMFDGSSFLSEYTINQGKVFLFNSAPVLSWNNFPLKAFFAPFINKLVLTCASKIKTQNSFIAGSEITADISNRNSQQIKIERPDGLNEYFNSDSLANKNYLNYFKTDRTGIYKFLSGNKLIDHIAINHDPQESVTEKSSIADFNDYLSKIGFEGKFYSLVPSEDFTKVVYESRFGTELWKYFLIIALIIALSESFVASSSKRDLINLRAN